jgi:hypothetical protein
MDKQLTELWTQVENIVTILDPKLQFGGKLPPIKGKVEDEDVKKILKTWLDYLRIAVKYKQFEIESLTRERDAFYNLLMEEKRK